MFEKILVCLDGSRLAEQILPYAGEQAIHFGSRVVLIHVATGPIDVPVPVPGELGVFVVPDLLPEQIEKAEAYLEQVAQPLREKGLDVECVILSGAPGDTIISYAHENEVKLIAIATHGRSGLGRLAFGSVADFVLRESELPILVMKPRHTEN